MVNKKRQGLYCFPDGLLAQLARIPKHCLTVVEAPSGFGKTTAVREYLTSAPSEDVRVQWYTCLGESPAKAWAGICGLFDGPSTALAEGLLGLGVPEQDSLPDISALLQNFHCDAPTFLVIDNYQLFATTVQRKLITALGTCRDKNVHLIIITQPLKDDKPTAHDGNPHHLISPKDFFFDHACIAKYCRLSGILITPDVVDQIQATTDGWVAAIRLQLKDYKENGRFLGSRDINSLVEIAIWNKLSADEKKFLLALSLLDGFTAEQAAVMGDGAAASKNVADLLSLDFFIRYVADKGVYSMHSILREYLLHRFSMQPQDFKDAMHRKAAEACLMVADYYQAALFYWEVADYDAILSMPFTDQYFFNNQEHDIIQFFAQVFQNCPQDVLLRHPLTILAVGIQFYKKGMAFLYNKVVKLVKGYLATPPPMPEVDLYKIKGEFEMLLFFSRFNDVAKMGEHHRKAYEYLRHVSDPPRSGIYVGNLPWAVGIPSVISAYWNKSGGLQSAMDAMDVCLPFYSQLAGGHGLGGEILMHAEACLASGDDTEAETLCYKTLYASKNAGQTSNCLCAELVLARIGILRGDTKAYDAARHHIGFEMEQARQTALTRLGEMCLAHLDMAFGKTDELPGWIRHVDSIRKTLYKITQPHAIMLHCQMLLLEKRRSEFYALTEIALDTAQTLRYSLLQTYHLIFLARAKLEDGCRKEAAEYLCKALSIAVPDRVFFPFAEHGEILLPLLEDNASSFRNKDMEELAVLCRRYASGLQATLHAQQKEASGLTPREKETMRLAQQRLTLREIASQLYISVNTVKTFLKSGYKKLGVTSRAELQNKKF